MHKSQNLEFKEKMLKESKELFIFKNSMLMDNNYVNQQYKMSFRCNSHPDIIQKATCAQVKTQQYICNYCREENKILNRYNIVSKRFEEQGFILLDKIEDFVNKGVNNKFRAYCINHPNIIQNKQAFDLKFEHGCKYCWHDKQSRLLKGRQQFGEENPNWKGGITSENHRIRTSVEYIDWRNKVLERDKFTCQCCGDNRGGNLQAHHIENFADNRDLIFDLDNGITLCNNCHNPSEIGSYHNICGVKNNNLVQLTNFIHDYRNGHVKNRKNVHTFVGKLDDSANLLQNFNGDTFNIIDIFNKFELKKGKLKITIL